MGGSKILNILWTSCKYLPRPRCGWSGAATGSPSSTATPTGSSPSRATSSPSRDQPWLTKTFPRWIDSEITGFGRCCLCMVHVENYKRFTVCWLSCRMNNLSSGRLYSVLASIHFLLFMLEAEPLAVTHGKLDSVNFFQSDNRFHFTHGKKKFYS